MVFRFLFCLFFILGLTGNSQPSVEDFVSEYQDSEKVEPFNPNFTIKIKDSRLYEMNSIELQSLMTYIYGFFELTQDNTEDNLLAEKLKLKPKTISIKVIFLNFIENNSGKASLKGNVKVEINGGDYNNNNHYTDVSYESFTEIKFKKINSPKNKITLAKLSETFKKQFAKKVHSKISERLKDEGFNIFKAYSIGVSNSDNESLREKEALLNAMNKASEMVSGIRIENISRIEDFGSVTDKLESRVSGNILDYEILEGTKTITKGKKLCFVLKSIVKK